jgi:chemotaxis family two-component system response regulator Rcp1
VKTGNYYKLAHILLLDDNPQDAHLIEMALTRASTAHHLTMATGREEALPVVHELSLSADTQPDLILLGLNPPNLEGLAILREIKRNEQLRAVPVVVLTSSLAGSLVKTAYGLHANCCVHKRHTGEELFAAIDSVCRFWLQTVSLPRTPWWT